MARPAPTLATYDDLLHLPDGTRAEVIAGTLEVLAAPRPRHSNVQRALGRFVGGPFDDDDGFGEPGGWWIFLRVDIELAKHDVLRPDLAGWRRARLPQPDVRPITLPQDWAREIVSPAIA